MIFVMDVGNTHTTAALFHEGEMLHFWRITTARHRTQDEWGALLKSLFHFNDLRMQDVEGVIICSVVPPADAPLRQMCLRYFKRDPLFVAPGIKTGIHVHYDPPGDVGADRIVNAVAVCAFYKTPAVVVDFGTATTFDVISEGGEYLGGVITPGIGISS
jgi:type III pantothenate kinase